MQFRLRRLHVVSDGPHPGKRAQHRLKIVGRNAQLVKIVENEAEGDVGIGSVSGKPERYFLRIGNLADFIL